VAAASQGELHYVSTLTLFLTTDAHNDYEKAQIKPTSLNKLLSVTPRCNTFTAFYLPETKVAVHILLGAQTCVNFYLRTVLWSKNYEKKDYLGDPDIDGNIQL
jgi:hypothetical protein